MAVIKSFQLIDQQHNKDIYFYGAKGSGDTSLSDMGLSLFTKLTNGEATIIYNTHLSLSC